MEKNKNKKVLITFEAGPTHNGLESAKGLVDAAVEAGGDAVKFQMVNADRLMADKTVKFTYKILVDKEKNIFEEKEEALYDVLKRRELKSEEWLELKKYCDAKPIRFFATATFDDEVNFLVDDLKVDSIKIASADIDCLPFLKFVASKKVNIQLDTGSGNIWEIERAVNLIEAEGNHDIIIHHCPSGYPAQLESINLKMIKTLKHMFPELLIAYSDHTPGWDMDIAAITLGAGLIEKTITMDRTTPSIEHCFSLEPEEAKQFVQAVRDLETALGSTRRVIPEAALEARKLGRRSICLKEALQKGDEISIDKLEFRRPGYGISPAYTEIMIGKKASQDLPADHVMSWEDVQ